MTTSHQTLPPCEQCAQEQCVVSDVLNEIIMGHFTVCQPYYYNNIPKYYPGTKHAKKKNVEINLQLCVCSCKSFVEDTWVNLWDGWLYNSNTLDLTKPIYCYWNTTKWIQRKTSIFYFRHSSFYKSLSGSFFSSRVSGVITPNMDEARNFPFTTTKQRENYHFPHEIMFFSYSHPWYSPVVDSPTFKFSFLIITLTKLVIFDTYWLQTKIIACCEFPTWYWFLLLAQSLPG